MSKTQVVFLFCLLQALSAGVSGDTSVEVLDEEIAALEAERVEANKELVRLGLREMNGWFAVNVQEQAQVEVEEKPQINMMEHNDLGSAVSTPTVISLNRQTFDGNVINAERGTRWVVKFCHSWIAGCDTLDHIFASFAEHWQTKLNKDDNRLSTSGLGELAIRFAVVDCSTDKSLCNAQNIDRFPLLAIYHRGQQQATQPSLGMFVDDIALEREMTRIHKWLTSALAESQSGEGDEIDDKLWLTLGLGFLMFLGTGVIIYGNHLTAFMNEGRETASCEQKQTNCNLSNVVAAASQKDAILRARVPLRVEGEALF